MNSLCIDLFCGLGGWAEGFLAEGYDVIGFDVERHRYPIYESTNERGVKAPGADTFRKTGRPCYRLTEPLYGSGVATRKDSQMIGLSEYPGQLVLQDVRALHGSQFRNATCIVASPPCQEFSFRAQPWKRARAKHPKELGLATPRWWMKPEGKMDLSELLEWKEWQRRYPAKPPSTELFDACFRIQSEACAAAGRYIPMVVENVKGAQPWVGRAAWHFGSFYLWGDVPALMPMTSSARKSNPHALAGSKNEGGSWFAIGSPGQTNLKQNPDGRKVPGLDWSKYGQPGYKAEAFNDTAARRYREGMYITSPQENDDGIKVGGGWWHDSTNNLIRKSSSKSNARKAASAQIAKIPFPLANWIARCFRDERTEAAS